MSAWIDGAAVVRVLVVGMVAGAGLPALFAVGLRAVTFAGAARHPTPITVAGSPGVVDANRSGPAGRAGALVLAVACFAVVGACLVAGVLLLLGR